MSARPVTARTRAFESGMCFGLGIGNAANGHWLPAAAFWLVGSALFVASERVAHRERNRQ